MLPLIRTLVDICLLRRGPEDIPASWILLYMSMALWLLAMFMTLGLLANYGANEAWLSVGSAIVGAICYVFVLVASGYGSRGVPTVTAIVGCSAIIWFAQLAVIVILNPIDGGRIGGLVSFVVLIWSVPVKGHIIARAINWHWYAGIVVAFSIFLLQLAFTQSMAPEG